MKHPFLDVPHPTVIGHRGSAVDCPENTLSSFERALAVGAHILESDVHATRDGVAVLSHDASLERMTGAAQQVDELDLAAVQALDAGYGFAGGECNFPFRNQGVSVPSVRDAFEAFPAARFNLEIKSAQPGLVASVVALVAEFERADRTLLAAGEDAVMAEIRRVTATTGVRPAIGASLADVVAFVESAVSGADPGSDSMALQIPTEFAGQPLITERLVEHAHEHAVAVHAWTINDEAEMRRLLDLGVDGIVTDDPGAMFTRFHAS
jgi:glycerophosphoryl diester phosphodiesterase